tara:strand:+ start:4214 stop:4966 length:753 start_codon:yes stop_codon:yes gene_type:complete
MEILDIVGAGGIIFLAGMGQSVVGFGHALFATPLLVWIGVPLPSVITLVATCSMLQAAIGVQKLHAAVPWRLSLFATVVRIAGVGLGLLLLNKLVLLNTAHIRMVIGSILCLLIAIQVLWGTRTLKVLHWSLAGFAFISSGLLAGLCGMGGPPLVLWSMANSWSSQTTRAFLFAVFASSIPVQLVLLCLMFGIDILWNAALGIVFLPLIYLGAAIGVPLGNRISKKTLCRVAYGILLVIGVSAVVPAFLV